MRDRLGLAYCGLMLVVCAAACSETDGNPDGTQSRVDGSVVDAGGGIFVLDGQTPPNRRDAAAGDGRVPPPSPDGCVATCDGRECGDDGCGGSCGDCSGPEVCTPAGQCFAPSGAREDILANIVGFGAGTTGGAGRPVCTVTNLNDSGAGSLRACAAQAGWVVFEVSGTINLGSSIRLVSNTTLDGRGQDVTVSGEGIQIRRVENVIVHNLKFANGNDDAIKIRDDTSRVWIDHVSLSGFGDGLVDITNAATDVTVSWCELTGHDKVMLISGDAGDSQDVAIRVTMHHNYFHDTVQRHPRIRWGRVHAFNNYITNWSSYAAGASQLCQFLSERNIYEAGGNNNAIIADALGSDPEAGNVRSVEDSFLNGAQGDERNPGAVFSPPYSYTAQQPTDALRDLVRSNAGWQSVPLPPS